MALGDEAFDQASPDEARAAGDECASHPQAP
jgi:hypothetical protein